MHARVSRQRHLLPQVAIGLFAGDVGVVEEDDWERRLVVDQKASDAVRALNDRLGVPDTEENRARFVATIPLGRMCDPTDVANAAVFLASDASRFVNGHILYVDGGVTATL